MEMIAPTNTLTDILARMLPLAEKWLEKQVDDNDAAKPSEEQRMLTPKEASKILQISWQTVMEWCREGKIEAFKIGGNKNNGMGGKWAIPREAIDAYLNKQRLIHGDKRRRPK